MPGGAEVELSMLFADIRGSTTLAENMSTLAFSQLISSFFATSTDVLVRRRAWIDRLVGDQVIGLFVPGFAGQEHARLAVRAAQEMLHAMGHADSEGPWVPVGIGVHTEKAFVGAVGRQDRATDITVLGDAPNIAARLSSAAAAGEILFSASAAQAAFAASDIMDGLQRRQLSLKGKSEPVAVYVLRDYDPLP
ncbi:MAG: adenylate/guanylate cyclase domain-containing protein [Candidatus Promineifilaceae bacterium]|nr:adenylate/guanylate cyclase domain-containing protein [Candidatus Promineifilaceae bacterium]